MEFWQELLNAKATNEELDNVLYYRCATDLELFSTIYFPHYLKFAFSDLHYDLFADYKYRERKVRRATAAPRGYAKSVVKAFLKILHDVCYGLEKFIVIFSNTKDQSVQKLKDIQAELLTNDDLIADYGSFLPRRKISSEDYVCDNGSHKVRLLAVGSKTEVRGIRFGESRPTKVLVDDLEHSTEVENEAIREKMEELYRDVISKIGDGDTNIEFVGTVLHRESLLQSLLNNPKYDSRQYKAIRSWSTREDLWKEWREIYTDLDNEDRKEEAEAFFKTHEEAMLEGTDVLWPEKEPYYFLMEEIIETGMRSFLKEKQNEPQSSDEKIFDPALLRYFTHVDEGIRIEKTGKIIPWCDLEPFAAMDPATGQTKPTTRKKGDFTCILVGYKDPKKRLFVDACWLKRQAPHVYIGKVFDYWEEYEFAKMGVETNLYRNLLLPNIAAEKKRREKESGEAINIRFYDIVQSENKEKRIYTLEPKVCHGWIYFNRTLPLPFFNQLFDFPAVNGHDDGPDALEMLWSLANGRYKVAGLPKSATDR